MTELALFSLRSEAISKIEICYFFGGNRDCGDLFRAWHGTWVRPAKRCSKYCVGMAALGQVSRYNHFLPTMRKLGQPLGHWSETPSDQIVYLHSPSSILNFAAA